MLASGDDKPVIKTINRIGMERAGISRRTINVIRQAHNLLFRRVKSVDEVRSIFEERLDGIFPFELSMVLASIEQQQQGTNGRAREAFRDRPPESVSKIAA
jgi:acyl-[acyl carrier protein]--UDP-N-acetylglucosamine O-acyltransferase